MNDVDFIVFIASSILIGVMFLFFGWKKTPAVYRMLELVALSGLCVILGLSILRHLQ